MEERGKDSNRHFTKIKKHMKTCPTSLVIRDEIPPYRPTRKANIKKDTIPSVGGDVEQLELLRIVGRSIKWTGYFGKQSGSFL